MVIEQIYQGSAAKLLVLFYFHAKFQVSSLILKRYLAWEQAEYLTPLFSTWSLPKVLINQTQTRIQQNSNLDHHLTSLNQMRGMIKATPIGPS